MNESVFNEILLEYDMSLTQNSLRDLINIFSIKKYKKGEIIARQNQSKINLFFLLKGFVCSYLIDQNDKNYIRSLFTPISTIAPINAITNQPKLNIYYQCLSDTELLVTDYNKFQELTTKKHDIALLLNKISIKEYSKLIERITLLTTSNGTERYLNLKSKIPDIDNQIPQNQIAYYLNITPVQLSRIKKKLLNS